ncbi:MAG: hypothetical protein WB791_11465 [Waddliaceae bacterium]
MVARKAVVICYHMLKEEVPLRSAEVLAYWQLINRLSAQQHRQRLLNVDGQPNYMRVEFEKTGSAGSQVAR